MSNVLRKSHDSFSLDFSQTLNHPLGTFPPPPQTFLARLPRAPSLTVPSRLPSSCLFQNFESPTPGQSFHFPHQFWISLRILSIPLTTPFITLSHHHDQKAPLTTQSILPPNPLPLFKISPPTPHHFNFPNQPTPRPRRRRSLPRRLRQRRQDETPSHSQPPRLPQLSLRRREHHKPHRQVHATRAARAGA